MSQTESVCDMLVFGPITMPKKSEPSPDEKPTVVSATLGSFIRARREMADLSLRQLSAMAEISNAYLSQIERDLHEPSIRVLNNVGRALGLSPETLMAQAGLIPKQDAETASGSGRADGSSSPATMSTEDAIAADPHLSEDEKQALLTVYRSYRSAKG